MRRRFLLFLAAALAACSGPDRTQAVRGPAGPAAPVVLSIVGTSDLHGHVERLPILAGYVENLRAVRGDRVLLIDGGDMFQGTLESNLEEGKAIVEAYNAMGYAAVAVGNHEFDFGPEGPSSVASAPEDDPRGALKARAAQAHYPFLASNIEALEAPNIEPSTLLEVSGIKIGIVGVSTYETPSVTLPANFEGLRMRPLAQSITAEAQALRARGAKVVIATAHAGAHCESFAPPEDLSSCDDGEILQVAKELPPGLVDVIVAGHTHQGVAHVVGSTAIIESYALGQAFGRVDLELAADGSVQSKVVFPPRALCEDPKAPVTACNPGDYEGRPVKAHARIAEIARAAQERARPVRQQPLGVTLGAPMLRSRSKPSQLGHFIADQMLALSAGAQIAMVNGGGLRADLPEGLLSYGALYEAFPFDNRMAQVVLTGAQLEELIAQNLQGDRGILSFAGLRARAFCGRDELIVEITGADGRPLADEAKVVIATSDFLASGGDELFGKDRIEPLEIRQSNVLIREALADALRKRGGTIDPGPLVEPRIAMPSERPVRCGDG